MHKDNLKWVDEAWKAELKANPKPNELQEALAQTIEDTGGQYMYFATFTFRPNAYEEIMQTKGNDDYERNMKVSWTEGAKVVTRSKRGFQGDWSSGGVVRGSPGVSPGWSARAADGAVTRFITKNKHLRKTRWFMCIEGSKYRNCAHGHGMFANAGDVPWEYVSDEWEKKYGRFRLDLVNDKEGMAMYLCKRYVGKEYKTEDFMFKFSRNCRRPVADPLPKIAHQYRHKLFLNNMKSEKSKKAQMVRWKDFKEMIGATTREVVPIRRTA